MRSRLSSIAAVMRLGGVGALVVAGTLALSGGPAMAGEHGEHGEHGGERTTYTCSGGEWNQANPPASTFVAIPSGHYRSITVKGVCQPAPGAVITVAGDVNVAAGAVFDAQTFPSTITVRHDVTADPGSLLGLGCLPNPTPTSTTGHPCKVNPDTSSSNIKVGGNITAWYASTVLLNGITVNGNVTLFGSEGTASVAERAIAFPWSIKTNTIGGDLIVGNMTPLWIGVILNQVGGNVILFNVHITDGLPPNNDPSPTIFVASNTIGWNLVCVGLAPAVAGGFFPTEVNVVGGLNIGQCPLTGG